MTKLEKVALRMSKKLGRPLVLVFNNVHLLQNNEQGNNILLQLQQRAETWAESGRFPSTLRMRLNSFPRDPYNGVCNV
jgi:hypothetical protein